MMSFRFHIEANLSPSSLSASHWLSYGCWSRLCPGVLISSLIWNWN